MNMKMDLNILQPNNRPLSHSTWLQYSNINIENLRKLMYTVTREDVYVTHLNTTDF